jgi:ABC-type nitrate/sulfonate/bicarbonate transport system ATPase subunit
VRAEGEDVQRQRSMHWLKRLGLETFTNTYPHELSGGIRQRVAIARAFVLQPDILLAGEAFGHLDEVTAAEPRETFLALASECGSTAILITYQFEEAISVGDRIVVFGKSAPLLAFANPPILLVCSSPRLTAKVVAIKMLVDSAHAVYAPHHSFLVIPATNSLTNCWRNRI